MVMLASVAMMAQDPYFEGRTIVRSTMQYENNFDEILAKVKASIQANTQLNASEKGMALMFAKPIVKNTLKQQAINQYIIAFPDGEYEALNMWDGKNNRISSFVPALGRVMIWDGNSGELIVAFPSLKLALRVVNEVQKTQQWKNAATYRAENPGVEVTEINGYKAVPNYAITPKDSTATEDTEIVIIDGAEYMKLPAPGYILEHYSILVQQTVSNEYFTQEQDLLFYELRKANDANYTLPAGYKVVDKADGLVKELKKAIKKGTLAIPYDLKQIPDVVWDIFQ